jgi:V8-like Glu-specific endopeptidase
MAAVVMSGTVALAPGPVQAAPKHAGPGVVRHDTGVETAADATEVRRFWTPRRMARAVPRTLDAAPRPAGPAPAAREAARRTDKDAVDEPRRWRERKSKGRAWKGGGDVVSTSGVLFFILDESFFTCSASLVKAPNKSTVVTAAHCLHNGQGDSEENVASFVEFVPGIPDGEGGGTFTGPPGAWVATEIVVTEQWATEADTDYDVGMIEVQEHEGQRLQEAVGAAPGIKFFDSVPKKPAPVHAFGYPTNYPYTGAELAYCAGPPARRPKRDTQALRLACNMGEGSSGGPWLKGFGRKHDDGLGRMVAVTSFGYADDRKGIYGPYFQDEARAVYRTIQGHTAPPAH